MLKVETKVVHYISDSNWDRFLKETFPNCLYHGIACEEEMGNDSTWSTTVKGILDEGEIAEIEDYLREGIVKEYSRVHTGAILDYLVHNGTIPEGYYNIRISW